MTDPEDKQAPQGDTPVYVIDEQVGYLLRKAYQRNAVIFGEKFQGELTPTQFALIARLRHLDSVSQNELGRRVGLDVATTKGVVDRLLGRGLIRSDRDPNDRRRQLISLTPEGERLFDANAGTALDVSAETLAPLTVAERKTFLRLLKKLQ
ncbi:MarR family winged helix-turn-helix transcriptional regulator [Rhodospirillum sp. A1_3_36]|uniref:MarR family winged helix-turn-helix transcriptional regulator n=1 Tax=Rhodospirillum sp. A1_3_36 TaxID=3391666 RepID=UPI0039A5BD3E